MIIKSLILGLVFTLGIFAVKSGIGLFYAFRESKKFLLVSFFSYLLVFSLSYIIIIKINLLNHFEFFQNFLKSAMWGHLTLSTGMILWGISILTNIKDNTKAFFMLILPCPFCSLSIFLALSFLIHFTGSYSFKWLVILFLMFNIIQLIVMLFLSFTKISNINDFLGYCLIFVGLYFLIIFCFAPVFSKIERIYRISSYANIGFAFDKKSFIIYVTAFFIVLAGFLKKKSLGKVKL